MPESSLRLTSPAFESGGLIPAEHTCEGRGVSPALRWEGVPQGCQSLALVVEDPDAPGATWDHWVIFAIPPDTLGLEEAFPQDATPDGGPRQGKNGWGKTGWGGPCPPSGSHRYFFRLYALDTTPDLPPGISKSELLQAIQGHVLAQGELMGRYEKHGRR